MGACVGKSKKNQNFPTKPIFDLATQGVTYALSFDILSKKPGRITMEYTFLNPPIGRGKHSEIRKCIHRRSGQMRAVKIIQLQLQKKTQESKVMREVDILQLMDHPNILKMQEFYQDDRFYYIVSEFCSGGDLFQKIVKKKQFTEMEAAVIIKQVLKGLYYLHSNGYMHRDIRPENILYDTDKIDAQLRVADLGSAIQIGTNSKHSKAVGQAYYMAPELQSKKYGEKCDIWSVGVLLYILLCGYPPFAGKDDEIVLKKSRVGRVFYDPLDWNTISVSAKEFINKMIVLDANQRYSAQEALLDPWMKQTFQLFNISEDSLKRIFQNMTSFSPAIKLQGVTLNLIVFFLATKEEKQELMQVFQFLDQNDDGKLSMEEIAIGMSQVMDQEEAQQQANKLVTLYDKKSLGFLDYSSNYLSLYVLTAFLLLAIDRQSLLTINRMETAFKMIDRNASGGIQIDELKETFRCTEDSDQHDILWKQLIGQIDTNQDGNISLSEFKQMLLQLTKP